MISYNIFFDKQWYYTFIFDNDAHNKKLNKKQLSEIDKLTDIVKDIVRIINLEGD